MFGVIRVLCFILITFLHSRFVTNELKRLFEEFQVRTNSCDMLSLIETSLGSQLILQGFLKELDSFKECWDDLFIPWRLVQIFHYVFIHGRDWKREGIEIWKSAQNSFCRLLSWIFSVAGGKHLKGTSNV